MSDNYLIVIPTCSTYTPDNNSIEDISKLISKTYYLFDVASTNLTNYIRFIDQGYNFERILCPICGRVMAIEWWQKEMDEAYQNDYRDLTIRLPCCNNQSSLNDLEYVLPAGFSHFSIEFNKTVNLCVVAEK